MIPIERFLTRLMMGFASSNAFCDEHGRVVDWIWREANAAFEEQSGLRGAVGKSASKVLPNLGRAWPGILTRVLQTGVLLRTEDDYSVDLDRWWRCHYTRLGGPGSRLVSVRFEDITERARAARALQESEEKYRTIFSTIDEGFAVMDLRTSVKGDIEEVCFREVNESFERQTGLNSVVGKAIHEVFPEIEQEWLDIYARVVRTGEPCRVEGYVKDLNGWYNAHLSLIGGLGSKSVAVVFRNVTERHKREELQREHEQEQSFLLRFGDLIRPLADLKAIAATTTRVAAEYFQADRCWIARISPEEGKAWLEHEARRPDLFSIEGEYNLVEYPEVMKNAKTETLIFPDVQGSPELSVLDKTELARMRVGAFLAAIPQKGNREYFWDLVIATDGPRGWSSSDAAILNGIAERTWSALVRSKEEAALRETKKLAVVGRLASSIAHEINNPLEAITNLLYLIEQSRLPDGTEEYLQQAQAELRRISEITMETLRFSRKNSTRMAVELSDVVESVVNLHDGKLKMARVQMERRYRSHSMLVCFPNELRQVIANLIGNAIDSMSGLDNPRLYLRARDAHDPVSGASGVRLTIADTGAGMGRSTLRRIWDPFFTTKGATGTGLGLWVTREIVHKHQGSVTVRSCTRSHRHGSVFSVFLPHVAAVPNAVTADEVLRAIA